MKAHILELLGFDKLFENEEFDQINALRQLPLFASIELLSWTTAQISIDALNLHKHAEMLQHWIERLTPKERVQFRNVPNSGVVFIALPVSLQVTELLLEHADKTSQSKRLTDEQVLLLFKVYLHQSLQYTTKLDAYKKNLTSQDFTNLDKFIELALPSNIPYFDLTMSSKIQIEIYKAAAFFKYCLSTEEEPFLRSYLSSLGYKSWEEYLSKILALYFHLYNELKNNVVKSGIELDPNDGNDTTRAMKELLELLKIDLDSFQPDLDFMAIRAKPVIQIEEDMYIIPSNEILLNKIFQVIQFNFGDFIAKNGGRIHNTVINRALDYKTVYSSRFSEEALLYNLLSYIINSKRKYFSRTGLEIKAIVGANKTEPDYYIREGNNIYVFECKDVLFSIAAKTSCDIAEVRKEIDKKLVKNQSGKPKGVGQLAKVIEDIAQGDYTAIDSKIPSPVNIYPILLITDVSFAALGINHILNTELIKLTSSLPTTVNVRLKPLTLMRMDTLIEFRDVFRDETVTLKQAIGGYTSKLRNPSAMLNGIQSFDDYMQRKYKHLITGFWGGMQTEINSIISHISNSGMDV